jgi:hypothetical protein
MFGFLNPKPRLLSEVHDYLRHKSEAQIVVAVWCAYLPHGGNEIFWFHPDGDEFDCHAARTRLRGGVTVRQCRVPMLTILGALEEAKFFEMRDAQRKVIDGGPFHIAVAERTREHHVSGNHFCDQPQTILFRALTVHFPVDPRDWRSSG